MTRVGSGKQASRAAAQGAGQEKAHVVRSGDTLSRIARAHGLSLAELLRANPQIKDPDRISVGQQLKLPAPAEAPPSDAAGPAQKGGAALAATAATSGAADRLIPRRRGEGSKLAVRDATPAQDTRVDASASMGLTGLIASNRELHAAAATRELEGSPVGVPTPGPRGTSPFSAELGREIAATAKGLGPQKVRAGDAWQLLDGVKDGDVTVEIPLKAGKYKARGVGFKIEPNTVMRVQLQVRDGALVPAKDRRGRDTGGGCKVEIDPPADLPLWTTGRGAYLRDRGEAQAQFKVDIGGFFDLNISKRGRYELKDVMQGFKGGKTAAAGGSASPLPSNLLEHKKLRFTVADVSLRDGVIDTGSARIDLAPGSKLSMVGDGRRSELKGQVRLDSMAVNQDGLTLSTGPGSAKLSVRARRNKDGTVSLRHRFSGIEAELKAYEAEQPRFAGDPEPDRVTVGRSRLKDSSIELDLRLRQPAGVKAPEIIDTKTRVHIEAAGQLERARITVKDAEDDARLEIGHGRFDGVVDTGPDGTVFDVRLEDTAWEVRDLQTERGPSGLDLHHLRVQGDTRVRVDGPGRDYSVEADARSLELRVDDYRGKTTGTEVDLGRTEVRGAGKVKVGRSTGLELDGDLHLDGSFDDLKVRQRDGKLGLDLAAGSTIDADVSHLAAVKGRGFELDARGEVDLGLEGYEADLPGLRARGAAELKGESEVRIRDGAVRVRAEDANIGVEVDDAQIAPGGEDFSLDVARGSRLDLNLRELVASTAPGESRVKLGPGSRLDATLDGGVLTVGGQRVSLVEGSRARLDIAAMEASAGPGAVLTGRMSLEVDAAGVPDLAALRASPHLQVEELPGAAAKLLLTVDDVTLRRDGSFSLEGVGLDLTATIDRVTGLTQLNAGASDALAPGAPKTRVLEPLDLSDGIPNQAVLVGPHQSPRGVRTAEAIQQASPAELAGAATRAQSFNPFDTAKRIKDGTLELSIPVEGTLGEGYWKSADFEPGTMLNIQAEVRDGRLVPAKTKATFSKPGDAPLWVSAEGAEFDDDNSLNIKLGYWFDQPVAGLENMPLDVEAFVDRLQPARASETATKPKKAAAAIGLDGLKLDRTHVKILDATFKAGPVPVPGGYLDVKEGTKLSVSGTPGKATLSGRVDLNGVEISNSELALRAGAGRADLRVDYQAEGDTGRVTTSFKNFDLDVQYAVHKRANGDYIHLAEGRASDGELVTTTTLALDDSGMPTGVKGINVDMVVPRFAGRVEGARVTVPDADDEVRIEVGRSAVEGEIRVDANRIAVDARVEELDAAITDLDVAGDKGAASIDHARLRGKGTVQLSPERGLTIEGDVDRVELEASDLRSAGKGFDLDARRTVLLGKGKVKIDSGGAVDIAGDLHIDSAFDRAAFGGEGIGHAGQVEVADGSRLVADLTRFSFSKDGHFLARGRGGIDFDLADFRGEVAGLKAEGEARLYGGGAFEIDSARGVELPPRMNLDVTLRDAAVESPDKGIALDVAGGSKLELKITGTGLGKDGKPERIELGPGSRLQGALDGGTIAIPGLARPLKLGEGTGIDFQIDRAVASRAGAEALEGRLRLDAVIDMEAVELDRLAEVSGVTLERIDDAHARLRLDIERVRLRPDGRFELAGTELQLSARLGAVHGRFGE